MDVLREVRHTNLVSVMQFDRRAGAVVYESLPGSITLTRLLHGRGPLELAASLVLLEDSVSGLEALHNAGVLHRNLTPDSVVVETTGAVLLRDAGLAGTPVTAALPPGQQPYLAPEVLAGAPPTSAADLYAATAVFVESLGDRASNTAVRGDLRPLLTLGMAEDPSKRSATLEDFRRELDEYARATLGDGWRKDGRALLMAAAGQADAPCGSDRRPACLATRRLRRPRRSRPCAPPEVVAHESGWGWARWALQRSSRFSSWRGVFPNPRARPVALGSSATCSRSSTRPLPARARSRPASNLGRAPAPTRAQRFFSQSWVRHPRRMASRRRHRRRRRIQRSYPRRSAGLPRPRLGQRMVSPISRRLPAEDRAIRWCSAV